MKICVRHTFSQLFSDQLCRNFVHFLFKALLKVCQKNFQKLIHIQARSRRSDATFGVKNWQP